MQVDRGTGTAVLFLEQDAFQEIEHVLRMLANIYIN